MIKQIAKNVYDGMLLAVLLFIFIAVSGDTVSELQAFIIGFCSVIFASIKNME